MSNTRRLLEAAAALSNLLRSKKVGHAFHGGLLISALSNHPECDEIYCVVEGAHGQTHPFRRVRDCVQGHEDFTCTMSPWSNRLHVTYHRPIPPIEIEILTAGETGPRRLEGAAIMKIQGIPFLSVTEFIRAKLKAWVNSRQEHDALDICFCLSRYWNKVDINRVVEQDMEEFVSRHPSAVRWWTAIQDKYE